MADKDFFSLLNLKRSGLEKVEASVDKADYRQAADDFLEYMKKRKTPVFYRGWDKRTINKDYNADEAEKICEGHIVQVDVGENIPWQTNLKHDMEWVYCINRHEFLTTLGRAYWNTGDEKYTRAFKKIILDWIEKNPAPDVDWMLEIPSEKARAHFMKQGNWRPIEAGIRLYTAWFPCYYHFINSPEFTPEFHITMLRSMVDHARFLRRFYTRHVSYFNVSPNWGLMESNGLAHMGILLPEFRESEDWRNTALSRFEEQVRMQILPDGMHVERCTGYHLVCTFCILQITELASLNGHRVSQTWLNNLEKMINYVLYMMKPHGVYPMLSDGDESDIIGERASYGLWEDINNLNMLEDSNDLRYVLKAGARLFNRPDMLYMATLGKEGRKPEKTSAAFPDGGFYVSRSGWKKEDKYMAVNCGLVGVYDQNAVHGHADALSMDVSAFGKTLIIDPGRYMYEGPYRVWFEKTEAHNTVVVDGKDQSEMLDGWLFKTKAVPTNKYWIAGKAVDFFDGSHDGYERLDKPVTHRRRVLFIKPHYWIVIDDLTGMGKHDFDLYFHFPEKTQVHVDKEKFQTVADYGNAISLTILPCEIKGLSVQVVEGSEDPIQGWVSYDYAVKIPAPVLRYSKQGSVPARLTTILCPSKGKLPKIEAEWVADDVLEIKRNGDIDRVMLSNGGKKKYAGLEFEGQMLYAGFSKGNAMKRCFGAGVSRIVYGKKVILDATEKSIREYFEKVWD
jgi:hypothetical protein